MMCKSHLEYYEPPDKTRSPRFIKSEILRDLISRRARIVIDPSIKDTLNLVVKRNMESTVGKLCSFPNRHSKSQNIHEVSDWLLNELKNIGHNGTFLHKYSQDGFDLENVISNKNGSAEGSNGESILLCAHYDTILKQNGDDVVSKAPGANDNASGVAALLEIARIIEPLSLGRDIQFAFFSGEEQGLWGSTHYANFLKDKELNLHAVINMDMCGEPGFLSSNTTTYIDIDDGQTGIVSTNNEASKNFGLVMQGLANTYTNIDTLFDPIDASDYMPFEARGYVCIGAYDGSAISTNPHYHDKSDTIENLDFGFLSEVTKMVLAFILTEAL